MLHGRDPERAQIAALLGAARESRSSVRVLRGDAGVGKSALLDDARAQADGMLVLTARGVASESELPFAALHRLLRPALDRLGTLPPPQAAALGRALGLTGGHGQERFLVFAACLTLLADLAEDQPVLCLVDDAHWLDTASADALLFVARRLDAEGIVMLFAARERDVRRFDATDLESLVVHGLDDAAAAQLLGAGRDVTPAPEVRDRLVAQTGGNPLALLELPSALSDAQLAGAEPLPQALPVTAEMERVFLERIRRLPEPAQRLLVVAAADDTEQLVTLTRAAETLGLPLDALGDTERAALINVRTGRFEFRHPLVRSAVYGAATSSERRAAHRALAAALGGADDEDADRRAWHLAAAAVEPDERVVRALEDTAERALHRGGHAAAARALERAGELSADPAQRGRRLVAAARSASLAGRLGAGATLAERARPLVADPLVQAEIARVHGIAELTVGRPAVAQRLLLDAAIDVAEAGPRKALELLAEAAGASRVLGDPGILTEICQVAGRLAPALTDDDARHVVTLLLGFGAIFEGDESAGVALIEEGLAWAETHDEPRRVILASAGATWLGDYDRAAALLGRAATLARQRGAMAVLADALSVRAPQLNIAQRFDEAAVAASEAVALCRELGHVNLIPVPLSVLATVASVHGDEDETRRRAAEVTELAAAPELGAPAAAVVWALATLDLGAGRWAEALERLNSLTQPRRGFGSPIVMVMTAPDRVEAAARAGAPEDARSALELFEGWAGHSGAAWARPLVATCRALVASGDEATEHYEQALTLEVDARRFDLPRIRLLYGEHLRRERRRTDARVQLRAAIDGFDRLHAAPWAERARAELRASGETARKRDPSTLAELTPQELQVAQYVAQGLSNKEVAAQMFLSPRTIDAHLRRVFAKLGVTSRTQLARLPLLDGDVAISPRRREATAATLPSP